MSRAGRIVRSVRYPYANPAKYRGGPPHFFVVRGEVAGDPERTRTFWWERPNPAQPFNLRANIRFEPSRRELYIDNCLHVPLSLSQSPEVVVWAEGEGDAAAARRAYRVPATTHHRGALAATPEQAEHFRGYRGTLLVVADRDPAGYAGALARRRLLRAVGLTKEQVRVVRPADGVLAGGGGCGKKPCRCDQPCPLPTEQGADLKDHVAAGRTLHSLARVPLAELKEAAAQVAEQTAQGWRYATDE